MAVMLDDDVPFWEQHSGGKGHRDAPEWSQGDRARAEAFYAALRGDARMILDLMIDHPGQLLDADWIADRIRPSGSDGDSARRHMVSGSLGALSGPREESQRRYPFYWWYGRDGSPTRYAMKPTVAGLFRAARSPGHPDLPVARPTAGSALDEVAGVGYRAWSLVSLERTARLAIGETGYPDELGVRYVFDSTVANHGSVRVGDLAVIRDDKVVPGRKIRYRCPSCQSTDFKFRSRAERRFRCAACGADFDDAQPEDIAVRSYSADYARTWRSADGFFSTQELASVYVSKAAQHSIRKLDPDRLRPLLDANLVTGRSSTWYQSVLLRARRDTSRPTMMPALPRPTAATRSVKPSRPAVLAADRARSSSMTLIWSSPQPSSIAYRRSSYCKASDPVFSWVWVKVDWRT